jgi:hypothetical protein
MKLLGEEIDTEVAVLAGVGAGADADDLARAALEDQKVANADVVAGDGDCLGTCSVTTAVSRAVTDTSRFAGTRGLASLDDDLITVVVMVATVDGVQDTVGSSLEPATEGVVVT